MVGISEVSLFDCFNVVDEGYLLECVGLANTQHFQRDQTIRRQFGDACQGKITAKKKTEITNKFVTKPTYSSCKFFSPTNALTAR